MWLRRIVIFTSMLCLTKAANSESQKASPKPTPAAAEPAKTGECPAMPSAMAVKTQPWVYAGLFLKNDASGQTYVIPSLGEMKTLNPALMLQTPFTKLVYQKTQGKAVDMSVLLGEAGALGWELVSTLPRQNGVFFLFKKPA